MEESKRDKIFRYLQKVTKALGYIVLGFFVAIGLFLVFYVVSGKSAQKKGHTPLVGLYTIISPSMTPNIAVYDVVFTYRTNAKSLKVGDIITFYSTNDFFGGTPITHRIHSIENVSGSGLMFKTKGDANKIPDSSMVAPSNIIGKVYFKIPQLGRIQFFLASKSGWIIAIMIPSLAIIAYDIYKLLRLVLVKNKMLSMRNQNGNI